MYDAAGEKLTDPVDLITDLPAHEACPVGRIRCGR